MAEPKIDALFVDDSSDSSMRAVGFLDALGIAVYTTDAEGVITYYNDAATDLWGRQPIVGKDLWCGSWRILHPDGSVMPHDQCPMAIALKEGRAVRGHQAIAERPDGSRVWFAPYPTPLRDATGRIIGAVNALVDISRMKDAELSLRQSQDEFRDFFDSSAVALHWVGADGTILRANETELRLLGYEEQDYIGRNIADFHADQEAIEDILARLGAGEVLRDYEARLIAKDGSIREVLIDSSVLWREGKFIHTRCFTRDVTERRKAEQSFRQLFDSAAISLWEADYSAVQAEIEMLKASGLASLGAYLQSRPDETQRLIQLIKVKDVNAQSVKLFEASSKEELQGALALITGPDSEATFIDEFVAIADGRRQLEGEATFRTLSGKNLQVLYSISFPPPNGSFESVLITIMDVTERRTAEKTVRELNQSLARRLEELETIFNVAPIAIAVAHDPLANEISINPAGERMLGVLHGANASKSGTQAEKVPFKVLRNGAEVEADRLPMQRAARQEEEVADEEYEVVRADGTTVSLLEYASPLHDEYGSVRGSLGVFVDITERKAVESAIRASEERFRTLTSHAPVGIFLANSAGDRVMVNQRWQQYAGLTEEEANGEGWIAALHPDDRERVVNEWHEAVERGAEFASEYRFQTPDGKVTWLRGTAAPQRSQDGAVEGFVGTVTDITELKEAGNLKDQFLGLISHELRTPLATIYGSSRLLAERFDKVPAEDRQLLLTDVVAESLRLQRIIENLLLMTKLDATGLELEPISLSQIVEKSARSFERNHGRPVSLILDGSVPPVMGNTTYIELVLDNLIANAAKYSRPDSAIKVVVSLASSVEVHILDEGIGITPEDATRLFTPFYRSQAARSWASGVGVGLAVCKRVIEAQNGTIWAEPRAGGGSDFGFSLNSAVEG